MNGAVSTSILPEIYNNTRKRHALGASHATDVSSWRFETRSSGSSHGEAM